MIVKPGHVIFLLESAIGPWKKKCLADFGIVTQCLAPQRVNDKYLSNLLLKINAKVCWRDQPWFLSYNCIYLWATVSVCQGLSLLSFHPSWVDSTHRFKLKQPIVGKVPTIILGPGHGCLAWPSIAAVRSGIRIFYSLVWWVVVWPLISKYRATMHTQSPKQEVMASLFKPRGAEDDGLIR